MGSPQYARQDLVTADRVDIDYRREQFADHEAFRQILDPAEWQDPWRYPEVDSIDYGVELETVGIATLAESTGLLTGL